MLTWFFIREKHNQTDCDQRDRQLEAARRKNTLDRNRIKFLESLCHDKLKERGIPCWEFGVTNE